MRHVRPRIPASSGRLFLLVASACLSGHVIHAPSEVVLVDLLDFNKDFAGRVRAELLDRDPDWVDYRAIIGRVPAMREDVFRRLSGTDMPKKYALVGWMKEVENDLRDL